MVAVGKDGRSPTAELTSLYLGRAADLARGLGIEGPHFHAVEAPRALSGLQRQQKEADLLRLAAPPAGPVILLDERGRDLTSRQLSGQIAERRDQGAPALTFMIGGADGFAEDFQSSLSGRPVLRLSFGRATWPHMLVRAMLAEQLYRAMTLLTGHPYHRD